MSANLLRDPHKIHTFTDDLESFLHVLGWTALRYVPADDSSLPIDRAQGLRKFDECVFQEGRGEQGGLGKREALRGGSYPSEEFNFKQRTPLTDLLTNLSTPFKSLYAVRPPTTEDRNKINIPDSQYDECIIELSQDIRRYDRNIARLQSSAFFLSEIQDALDKKDWPIDDMADPNLPIASLTRITRIQKQRQTTRRLDKENMFEDSRGLSRSSKRASSPPPDPRSSKRRRSTLNPSNSTIS